MSKIFIRSWDVLSAWIQSINFFNRLVFLRQTVKYRICEPGLKLKSCVLSPYWDLLDGCSTPLQMRFPSWFKSFCILLRVCNLRLSIVPDKTINIFQPWSAIAINASILAVLPDWTCPITSPLMGPVLLVSIFSRRRIPIVASSKSWIDSGFHPRDFL